MVGNFLKLKANEDPAELLDGEKEVTIIATDTGVPSKSAIVTVIVEVSILFLIDALEHVDVLVQDVTYNQT